MEELTLRERYKIVHDSKHEKRRLKSNYNSFSSIHSRSLKAYIGSGLVNNVHVYEQQSNRHGLVENHKSVVIFYSSNCLNHIGSRKMSQSYAALMTVYRWLSKNHLYQSDISQSEKETK